MGDFGFVVAIICGILSPLLAYMAVSARRADFADPGSSQANAAATKIGGAWVFGHGVFCLAVLAIHFQNRIPSESLGQGLTDITLYAILSSSTFATFLAAGFSSHKKPKPKKPDQFQPLG